MANYNNENFKFRMYLRDKATAAAIGIGNLQQASLVLFSEFSGIEWMRFDYPAGNRLLTIEGTDSEAKLIAEVTTEDSANAPQGVILAELSLRFTDATRNEGFAQQTARGKLLNMRRAKS